jgi:hypothetical protein
MTEEATGWGGQLWAAADLVTPMAIRVAATLRLADHVADGRQTPEALAAAVDADPDALGRLLAHLVTAGVLSRADTGVYRLTAMGERLRDDDPEGLRPWKVRSDAPIFASSSCCTPCAPASRRSRVGSAARTGTTCRPTTAGPRRSTH